ncbi:hypothetical protein F8388_013038, partial [Cannabis sativa]
KEIGGLRDETVQIEKEINRVGDSMSSKMNILQNKADDIGNVAGLSLEKQKEVLKGQSEALNGLQSLTQFQSKALEESRAVLQQLANFGHEQQEELLQRQEKLQQAHDHLVENSKSMLAAQFEISAFFYSLIMYFFHLYNFWTWKGRKIHYVVQGEGSPVVLIHGFGASAYHWRYYIPELAKKHKVYAIDLLGFGWSEKAIIEYGMEGPGGGFLAGDCERASSFSWKQYRH